MFLLLLKLRGGYNFSSSFPAPQLPTYNVWYFCFLLEGSVESLKPLNALLRAGKQAAFPTMDRLTNT
jgi:hypothetical protein